MTTLDDLRNKRAGYQGQVTYWSRKVAEVDKAIKAVEKRDAVTERDGSRQQRPRLDGQPAGGQPSSELRRQAASSESNGDALA